MAELSDVKDVPAEGQEGKALAKKDRKDKKDKKEKKEKKHKDKKRSETDGVAKDKKDKKKDKARQEKLARALDAHLQADAAANLERELPGDEKMDEAAEDQGIKPAKKELKQVKKTDNSDDEDKGNASDDAEDEAEDANEVVYFAYPMADQKTQKKALKLVKKAAKLRAIHRGVKECEKAIGRNPKKSAGVWDDVVPGLVIIAADVFPEEVILHLPMHCEEHGIPYLFVRSRAALGEAACTKRATSIVMLKAEGKKDKNEAEEDAEAQEKRAAKAAEYRDAWAKMVERAKREYRLQVDPIVKGQHPAQLEMIARGENPFDISMYLPTPPS